MAKAKKPDVVKDVENLRKQFADAKMNAEGLGNMAERRLRSCLKENDLVGYGRELGYWFGRIDEYAFSNHPEYGH